MCISFWAEFEPVIAHIVSRRCDLIDKEFDSKTQIGSGTGEANCVDLFAPT
jgi:hypothetical protein